MNNKKSKKGFTLMEMLIVVAIIAILIAIAIPAFSSSLKKAKKASDEANLRSAYAEATVQMMEDGKTTGVATTSALQSENDTVLSVQGLKEASGDAIKSQQGEIVVVRVDSNGYATYCTSAGSTKYFGTTNAAAK